MKNSLHLFLKKIMALLIICSFYAEGKAMFQQIPGTPFTEYKGKVVNSRDQEPLSAVYLAVENSNVSTVTNSDGEFSLKIPNNNDNVNVIVSHLGFRSQKLPLSFFQKGNVVIELQETLE
ncbi:carboxypeptidase-like regulatory domain-containing protein, partial [Salinimicrobium oceani]